MQTFVLVHGAWHGGWCWRDVAQGLRERGHVVHTPTLTGLAERQNLLTTDVDLEQHVDDIVSLFVREDLRRVHLVGWSYGGIVISGALAEIHQRVRAVTYLDAFLPKDGESVADLIDPAEARGLAKIQARGSHLNSPDPATAWDITDEDLLAMMRPLLSAQPTRTLTQPVRALASWPVDIACLYVRCTGSQSDSFDTALERARREPGFETAEVEPGHAIAMTHPDEVIGLLDPHR